MFIPTDLHGHTLFSDGRATPEDYAEFRRQQQMHVIAISDHDVMAAVRRGAMAAKKCGMTLLPALEVTAFLHFGTERAEQFHVLAYYPPELALAGPLEETYFFKRGERVQAAWKAFVLDWLDGIDAADRDKIDPEGALEGLHPNDFPALQSTLTMIVQRNKPVVERFRRHHVKFWEDDRELFGWEPEEVIDAIRADGAVDVVAHAARYRDRERTEAILKRATGVEVYTSRHKPEVAAHYRAYAEANDKLWTASADDHQNARYRRPPCGTPHRTLERIMGRPFPIELAQRILAPRRPLGRPGVSIAPPPPIPPQTGR